MRYLGEDEPTQVLGIGYLGQVAQGPDGNLYQWVQGVDGLGNPIGQWRKWRRRLRRVVQRAMPFVQQVAPFIPGGAAALKVATPILQRAGVAGYDGLGQDELTQVMGIGYLGEVRQGPDGNLYQYVQGVDGLGNPIGGIWSRLKRGLKAVHRLAQRGASFIPGPYGAAIRAGLKIATPLLQKAGVAGSDGIGALYQAPDGTLYQVQGLAQDEELRGLAEDEELRGFAEDEELRGLAEDEELRGLDEDEELRGFAEDEELRGLAEDEELRGFAEDEELRGFAEDDELQGLDQSYVREDSVSGLEAYVPEQSPTTRWFVPPAQPPELWKPLW